MSALSDSEYIPQPTTKKPKRSKRKLVLWLSLVSMLGLIAAYVAADFGVYDPGFKLPVRIFNREQTVQVTEIDEPPVPQKTTTAKQSIGQENPIDPAKLKATETGAVDTSKWLLHDTKTYSVRVPDGWKLREKEGATGLYAESELQYIPNTPATVLSLTANPRAPQEFISSFIMDVTELSGATPPCQADTGDSNAVGSYAFSTIATLGVGVTVTVGTLKPQDRRLGEIVEGEVAYEYCVAAQNKEVRAVYVMSTAQRDVRVYVEAMLKSLVLKP